MTISGSVQPTRQERWDVARAVCKCNRCGHIIGAGEPYRRVARGEWKYCTDCAKTFLEEDPPADLPVIRIVDQIRVPAMTRIGEVDKQRAREARMLGEREVGEEG